MPDLTAENAGCAGGALSTLAGDRRHFPSLPRPFLLKEPPQPGRTALLSLWVGSGGVRLPPLVPQSSLGVPFSASSMGQPHWRLCDSFLVPQCPGKFK